MASPRIPGTWKLTREGAVLWVAFEGWFGGKEVENFSVALASRCHSGSGILVMVGDTSRVTGIDAAIHKPSQNVLQTLKGAGVEELVIVQPSATLAMVVRTTAFVSGLPTKCVPTMQEAQGYLSGRSSKRAAS